MAAYYPPRSATIRDLRKLFPDLDTWDEEEEDRLESLQMSVIVVIGTIPITVSIPLTSMSSSELDPRAKGRPRRNEPLPVRIIDGFVHPRDGSFRGADRCDVEHRKPGRRK